MLPNRSWPKHNSNCCHGLTVNSNLCCHPYNLTKLFTRICLSYQAVQFCTGQTAVMPCGWEGDHTFDITLIMHHRLIGIPIYGSDGLREADELSGEALQTLPLIIQHNHTSHTAHQTLVHAGNIVMFRSPVWLTLTAECTHLCIVSNLF